MLLTFFKEYKKRELFSGTPSNCEPNWRLGIFSELYNFKVFSEKHCFCFYSIIVIVVGEINRAEGNRVNKKSDFVFFA